MRLAHRSSSWRKVRFALRDNHFPLSYVLRNLVILKGEPAWQKLSSRRKAIVMRSVLEKRAHFFLRVREWLKKKGGYQAILNFSAFSRERTTLSYCIHCGGCCETPSGFPDFPSESVIPQEWKNLFSEGLGKGHRFCPFLWEYGKTGMSLCAIHPWRPNPCRVFGEEDCNFVLEDSNLAHVTHGRQIQEASETLLKMIGAWAVSQNP